MRISDGNAARNMHSIARHRRARQLRRCRSEKSDRSKRCIPSASGWSRWCRGHGPAPRSIRSSPMPRIAWCPMRPYLPCVPMANRPTHRRFVRFLTGVIAYRAPTDEVDRRNSQGLRAGQKPKEREVFPRPRRSAYGADGLPPCSWWWSRLSRALAFVTRFAYTN